MTSETTDCDRCGETAVFEFGSTESEAPVLIRLCVTHSLLLLVALELPWSD